MDNLMTDYLRKMARTIAIELKEDWDIFVVFDGEEGAGKSTLMQMLAYWIEYYTNVGGFKLSQIVYRRGRFTDRIYNLPKYKCVCHDELGMDAFSRDAMSKRNKELAQMLMVCRDQNKGLLACIPNFWWLDPYLRDHRCRYWIHVYAIEMHGRRIRGFAKIRKKMPNEFGGTPYWALQCIYRFNPMPPDVYAAYKAQKQAAIREAILDELDDSGKISNASRNKSMVDAHSRGMSYQKIADYWGLTKQTVHQIVKQSGSEPDDIVSGGE